MTNYGAVEVSRPQPLSRSALNAKSLTLTLLSISAVCALILSASALSSARPSALLGYDPFNSISSGKTDSSATFDDFAEDDGHREMLPDWATTWAEDPKTQCKPGMQCFEGNAPNPLGALGLYVMQATSAHFNNEGDYVRRHNCADLPGWALEECHRMREKESHMDQGGHVAPEKSAEEEAEKSAEEEAKARPISLAAIRYDPAMQRAMRTRRMGIKMAQGRAQAALGAIMPPGF